MDRGVWRKIRKSYSIVLAAALWSSCGDDSEGKRFIPLRFWASNDNAVRIAWPYAAWTEGEIISPELVRYSILVKDLTSDDVLTVDSLTMKWKGEDERGVPGRQIRLQISPLGLSRNSIVGKNAQGSFSVWSLPELDLRLVALETLHPELYEGNLHHPWSTDWAVRGNWLVYAVNSDIYLEDPGAPFDTSPVYVHDLGTGQTRFLGKGRSIKVSRDYAYLQYDRVFRLSDLSAVSVPRSLKERTANSLAISDRLSSLGGNTLAYWFTDTRMSTDLKCDPLIGLFPGECSDGIIDSNEKVALGLTSWGQVRRGIGVWNLRTGVDNELNMPTNVL